MIKSGTVVKVMDNSGAKKAKCIKVLGGYKKSVAKIGDLVVVAVRNLRVSTQKTFSKKKVLKLQNKDIFKALVIRTKQSIDKRQNIKYKFKENCVVLIDKQDNPVGTRIFGFVSKKIKKRFLKVVSLSLKKF